MIKTHTNPELLNDIRKLCKGVKEIQINVYRDECTFDYNGGYGYFYDANGNEVDGNDDLFDFDSSDLNEASQLCEYLEGLLINSGICLYGEGIEWSGTFFLDLDNGVITLDADCYTDPEEIRLELEEERHNLSKEYIEEYLENLPDFYYDKNKEQSKKFAPYGYAEDGLSLVPIVKFLMCSEIELYKLDPRLPRVINTKLKDIDKVSYVDGKPYTGVVQKFENDKLVEEFEQKNGLKEGYGLFYSNLKFKGHSPSEKEGKMTYVIKYKNDEIEMNNDNLYPSFVLQPFILILRNDIDIKHYCFFIVFKLLNEICDELNLIGKSYLYMQSNYDIKGIPTQVIKNIEEEVQNNYKSDYTLFYTEISKCIPYTIVVKAIFIHTLVFLKFEKCNEKFWLSKAKYLKKLFAIEDKDYNDICNSYKS